MNDYDEQVHRNARGVGLLVLSALVSFGVFYAISCAIFDWWHA